MSGSGPLINCQITSFIRGSNPVWFMVDLDGNPTDDTFWLYVLENTIPYIPATVYHDAAGTVPWTQPIQFLANGTLPIDIYYSENTVYRLEIRKSNGITPPSQSDPLIYLIEDYNPGNNVDFPDNVEGDATDNQIANAQFSVINFVSPLVLTAVTNPAPVEIAPGWELVLTGTGSVTVTQVPLNNALTNPTNAPYAIEINTSGWTSQPYLRQRFQQNGMNWANKYISSSVTARISGSSQIIQSFLVASDGATLQLLDTITLTSSFVQYQNNVLMPAATNANLPPNAYIDYRLMLPTTGDVFLTSFQVIASDSGVDIPYQQDTVDRQLDHLAHYYKPQLAYKPIPSYLIGWDFPLNPAQFFGDSVPVQAVGAGKSYYAWDQTIIFQSVNNMLTVSRNAITKGMDITIQQAGQFAIVQYIEEAQARELLEGDMSVYINGFTDIALGLNATVTLWATAVALPDLKTPNFNSPVTALAANGRPTMGNGTWVEIPRGNLGDAVMEFAPPISEFTFNGWTLTNTTSTGLRSTTTNMAIVIGFEASVATDVITLNSIGLNTGKIATRPAPKTQTEARYDCQRFYFSSFPAAVAPVTNYGVNTGCFQWQLISTGRATYLNSPYPATMRTDPTVVIYNPAAANNLIRNVSAAGDCGASAVNANSKAKMLSIEAPSGSFPGGSAVGDLLQAHITADARLGMY